MFVHYQFLQSRFDNDDGELYKCNGTFVYLGEDPEEYAYSYEPETDAAANFTNLINFLYTLNYATDEEFPAQIGKSTNCTFFNQINVSLTLYGIFRKHLRCGYLCEKLGS